MRACLAFNAAEAAAKAASVAVADALVVAPLVAALRVFAFFFLRCRFRCFLLGGSAFAFFLGGHGALSSFPPFFGTPGRGAGGAGLPPAAA